MQKLEIPYFDNTLKDVSGRLMPESSLQDSLNIIFDNKKIRNRYGIQQLSESLSEEILRIDIYKQLYADTSYVVAFTANDIFYLDTTGKWKYITRCFNIGTVAVSNGSKTVTLTGTSTTNTIGTLNSNADEYFLIMASAVTAIKVGMKVTDAASCIDTSPITYVTRVDTTNKKVYLNQPTLAAPALGATITFTANFRYDRWKSTDKYKIAFGYTDANLVPSASWYTVDSITSITGLTLTTNYTGTTLTAGTYVLRLCYSGDIDNRWSVCFPYDESMEGGGDKCMIATNGVDFLQRWQGFQDNTLTMCEDVFAYWNLCKNVEFFGTSGGERLLCSNIYDVNSTAWNYMAIEVSDAGEISWEDGATYPLFDSSYKIAGIKSLGDRFVVYKENSLSIGKPIYSDVTYNPYDIQQDAVRETGTIAFETVCDTGKFHIFFTGERICTFDGFTVNYVDDGIYLYVNRIMNSAYAARSYAFIIAEMKLYCLAIPTDGDRPDFIVVFNYEDNNFTFWKFFTDTAHTTLLQMPCKGDYIINYFTSWADTIVEGLSCSASASSSVTLTGTATNIIQVGMRIVPNGYSGSNLYIKSITSGTFPYTSGGAVVVVGTSSDESSVDPNVINATSVTVSGTCDIGFTAKQSTKRWIDLISEDLNSRHIFGGTDGKMYELSKYNGYDTIGTTELGIYAKFRTKSFELNKGGTFLSQEITLRAALLEQDETNFYPGSLDVSASVDYGRVWSDPVELDLDGTETFMEKKLALHMRGKALEFLVETELPFQIENCFLGFNVQGKSFKYDR